MKRPHIYGSEDRCRAALKRYIDGVEDLLGQAVGVRKRIAESKYPTSPISSAFIANDWLKDFDRWFDRSGQTMRKYLQDRFASVLPVLAAGVPPDTGKPRHVIVLDAAEPWLEKAVAELRDLQAAFRGATRCDTGCTWPAEVR